MVGTTAASKGKPSRVGSGGKVRRRIEIGYTGDVASATRLQPRSCNAIYASKVGRYTSVTQLQHIA